MSDNIYGDCRTSCEDAADFFTCIEACRDKPTMDLVQKHYGAEKAALCNGFSRRLDNAVWHLDKAFTTEATNQSASAPKALRTAVLQYYMMPIAPYPPGPDKPPRGVTNATPDNAAMTKFMEADPCYKWQFLSQAREHLEAQKKTAAAGLGISEDISAAPNVKFWLGLAGIGVAVAYFGLRKR